jgi:hypothetical protein
MLKKILVLVFVMLITVQAGSVFAADIPVMKFAPVLDGVLSENEYPADSVFVLDKTLVDSWEGCWAGEMTADMKVTFRFAWDDSALYIFADVKDSTPVRSESWDSHGGDGGPSADAFQLNLFAKTVARWLSIGAYADGSLSSRTHYGDISDLTDIVKGKAVLDDSGYVIECSVPWDIIDGGEAVKEGLSIPVLFTYMDRYDGGEVCYKTLPAATWPPSDEIDNYLVLGGAYTPPAPETEAPAVEVEVPGETPAETTPPAAQTSDAVSVMALAAVLSLAAVMIKKK